MRNEDLVVDEAMVSQLRAEAAIDSLKIEVRRRDDATHRLGLAGPLAQDA